MREIGRQQIQIFIICPFNAPVNGFASLGKASGLGLKFGLDPKVVGGRALRVQITNQGDPISNLNGSRTLLILHISLKEHLISKHEE